MRIVNLNLIWVSTKNMCAIKNWVYAQKRRFVPSRLLAMRKSAELSMRT